MKRLASDQYYPTLIKQNRLIRSISSHILLHKLVTKHDRNKYTIIIIVFIALSTAISELWTMASASARSFDLKGKL